MSDQDKKGYAVSPDAAATDSTSPAGDQPALDLTKSYVVIDGEKLLLIDLLKKVRQSS